MDPSEKVQNPASSLVSLFVLIFIFLSKGLSSQNSEYTITVPPTVSIQEGLCVHIPCNFTYVASDRKGGGSEKLWVYWVRNEERRGIYFYTHSSHLIRHILVATNDDGKKFYSYVVNRFQLRGNLEEGDCSFSILNARREDTGKYYLRIESGNLRYTYLMNRNRVHTTPQVNVIELTPPELQSPSAVFPGKEAVVTCSAPGPCSGSPPEIQWEIKLTRYSMSPWSHQHTNGSWTYGSNVTFTPSLDDQDKSLTCSVWYPDIQKQVKNTLRLLVADPPKTVKISTNSTNQMHLDMCAQDTKGDLVSAVAQEGESITLLCKAQSRPAPTLSWTKENRTLSGSQQGTGHALLLSPVRPEHAGEYQCQAENPFGNATKILRLCVLYGPKLSSNRSRSTCWNEAHSLHCNCSLSSWPPPQLQWQVDGHALGENNTQGAKQITSKPEGHEVTSTLSWPPGSLEKSHSIVCLGSNHLGTYSMHFLFPSPTGSPGSLVGAGFCGALVAVVLVAFCLCLIKFYKQKKAEGTPKASSVMNSTSGGHQKASDGSLIYSNIPPLGRKPPHINCSTAAAEKTAASAPPVLSTRIAEPDELYYAALEFSKLKAKGSMAPEEFIEYSEVKRK